MILAACNSAERPAVLESGRDIYGANCSVCHGPRGEGEIGPSLRDVAATWPTCAAHVEWVELGSDGWVEKYGGSYGATGKPVVGGMPVFMTILEPDEIAAVAAYERVEFGGEDRDATVAECEAVTPDQ